jgi:hypothetical protein
VIEEEYIGIVGEIFDGYTEFEFENQTVYLKHFSIRDQRYIHQFYEKYKKLAVKKGIPTEDEMLVRLKKDGLWDEKDDVKIDNLEKQIENLRETQRHIFLPSQKESLQKQIEQATQELLHLKIRRKEVVGRTAEDFASTRSNEEFIRYIIYKDPQLKEHFFTDEEFANLNDIQIKALVDEHQKCGRRLNEEMIQTAVLRDFFNMYISQTEDVGQFYGKPIVQLSAYQLKLALYARVFFNIFQYNDDIPEGIKKDPAAILRFSDSKRSKKGPVSKSMEKDSGGTAVFGATKEDLDFVDPNAKKISLSEEVKKKGGVLTMDDMIKMMGQ